MTTDLRQFICRKSIRIKGAPAKSRILWGTIAQGAEMLGWDLDKLLNDTLEAMKTR
ncbi:MAG: hypothetical protein IIY11_04080 [Clostridia bacterium]|nr:hypothetical protein [Clostridia bacterium]